MESLEGPPTLSTPDTHIFQASPETSSNAERPHISDEELSVSYEIERTVVEIRKAKYTRVALQFPDGMLRDAPRVFGALRKGLDPASCTMNLSPGRTTGVHSIHWEVEDLNIVPDNFPAVRLYILADTSYGACCVDEIAAEHVNADAVVHYGRACLSPTARLPVIYVFTRQPLWNQHKMYHHFHECYKDKKQKIILMADVTYQYQMGSLEAVFREVASYHHVHVAEILYDPSSPLPNRTVPEEVKKNPESIKDWHLIHISDPPESLLLTLASRVASIRIFRAMGTEHGRQDHSFFASTSRALNRRYAILTSVATVSIFGILVNTLSVRNYMHIVEHVKAQILAVGKKSYTFVVGKINAAKVANFSEVGAWVVIGCWESSLIDSKDFWKPVLTPFELGLALKSDHERVWTGEWSGDFQQILNGPLQSARDITKTNDEGQHCDAEGIDGVDADSEPDSAPPEYDLRTGRYISHSRPMQLLTTSKDKPDTGRKPVHTSVIKRAKGDLVVVGGEVSPGAEHLKSKRTWKGLGSDFKIEYEEEGAAIEQGRSGIARGYTQGEIIARS